MDINKPSDAIADLRIGATDTGHVRLYIVAHNIADAPIEIPMDFDPDEAQEIAREIEAAVQTATTHRK